ncbi:DUF5412 family protein [Virgibacillus halophilus]|uniref:DUF5412 family protein n=1 Tax=Tigheibacillus halophilus TaxID=361280 RepID=A0ABU5C8M6_9BACI|nr:DUF5412 family protein [Virgibacillus halophilus]
MFIFAAIFLIIGYRKYFFTFNNLGDGTYFKGPIDSPHGKYTAEAYYKNYGDAAGGAKVWVTITNRQNNETATVYYGVGKSNFGIKWEDENNIYIENDEGQDYPYSDTSVMLEVGKEIYDESGRACKSWLMKDEYETCYPHE